MYKKYNYTPTNHFFNDVLNPHYSYGNAYYIKEKKEVEECLSKYINEDGILNGSKIKDHWFEISKKDVFISHSHEDASKAIAFAGWLKEKFEIESFIDSCAWGYCDDLLKKIDNKYCYQPKKGTYNYNLRNYTTSHVHMMLSTALTEMLDNTECVIFFNTPNSIILAEELVKINNKKETMSPWIYHELSMMTMLRTNRPIRDELAHSAFDKREKIEIAYDVEEQLNTLKTLTDGNLQEWKNEWDNITIPGSTHPLDMLYKITNVDKGG